MTHFLSQSHTYSNKAIPPNTATLFGDHFPSNHQSMSLWGLFHSGHHRYPSLIYYPFLSSSFYLFQALDAITLGTQSLKVSKYLVKKIKKKLKKKEFQKAQCTAVFQKLKSHV